MREIQISILYRVRSLSFAPDYIHPFWGDFCTCNVCEYLFLACPSASHRKAIMSAKNGRVVNSLITLMESESEKVCLTDV